MLDPDAPVLGHVIRQRVPGPDRVRHTASLQTYEAIVDEVTWHQDNRR